MGMVQYYIINFIDHMLQINVQQKEENQWRVADLQRLLYTALLYQLVANDCMVVVSLFLRNSYILHC